MKKQKALLSWIPQEAGGRRVPPAGPSYSTIVRFEEDPNWSSGTWSVNVAFLKSFREGRYTLVEIVFLVKEAPADLLHPGSRFELLEGSRRVAKGIVLPETVPVPEELNEFESALIG